MKKIDDIITWFKYYFRKKKNTKMDSCTSIILPDGVELDLSKTPTAESLVPIDAPDYHVQMTIIKGGKWKP